MPSIESIDTYDAIMWEAPSISLGEKPDPLQMESEVKKTLKERVVADLTETKKTRYSLDNCVYIETYTDLFREKIAQAWIAVVAKFTLLRHVFCVGTAALAAVTTSILPLTIVAAGVCLIWFIYSTSRINQACDQAKAWSALPYQKPAEQRAKAYLNPFIGYYFSQGASDSYKDILHPNEVEYLYKKHLMDFCEKLLQKKPSTEQEKKAWMANFFTLNPLAPNMMQSGWEKIPSVFEELGQEYSGLFSAPITYSMLRDKFQTVPGFIGPTGPIGRTGMFQSSPYLYELEGLVVQTEQQLENLKINYLKTKEALKARHAATLSKFSPGSPLLALQRLHDQFDCFLNQSKDVYMRLALISKTAYLGELQKLKERFPPQESKGLDERIEKRWNALQAILIEDKSSIISVDQYEKARKLLEKALITIEGPSKKTLKQAFLDVLERKRDSVVLVL